MIFAEPDSREPYQNKGSHNAIRDLKTEHLLCQVWPAMEKKKGWKTRKRRKEKGGKEGDRREKRGRKKKKEKTKRGRSWAQWLIFVIPATQEV
jgi:hypothetical protein